MPLQQLTSFVVTTFRALASKLRDQADALNIQAKLNHIDII